MEWFDGHLDLAYIAQHGRDLTKAADSCGGTLQPATVTFPALAAGKVTRAIGVIFVRQRQPDIDGPFCFDDADSAFAAAVKQFELYRLWEREGWIRLAKTQNAERKTQDGTGFPAGKPVAPGNLETGNSQPGTQSSVLSPQHSPLAITLAIEGAACIRRVDDADFFADAGVRMVSLAWAQGSRWAGGDRSPEDGDITPDGRALVHRLDELGIVHDVSHLSERAFWSLLDIANGPIVASHSNARELLPGAACPQRHLSDAQIRALANRRTAGNARQGIIGINLFARFLIPPDALKNRRARIADVVRHLEHLANIAGRRDFLALGSDMDSGFGADLLPADLQGPEHLNRLAEALSAAGWSDDQIADFAGRWSAILALAP